LIAVGGLNSQDDSGWGVLSQHQRVGKRLEDGPVVVDVLLLYRFHFFFGLEMFLLLLVSPEQL
jgi:hypothetical protein